jgi:tRNA threonylcarbamoyl adenosine modification protein YeaZ
VTAFSRVPKSLEAMRVLAIDTALEACSAAVLDTTKGVVGRESLPMVRGHAEALIPLVGRVMALSGLGFADLDRIAVTVGPGSFTGLRVGVAAARGFALAAGKPAVGLTTLAAYAAPHVAADDQLPLLSVIDARNEQVYMQLFGPGGRTIIQPRIAGIREAVRAASAGPARIAGTGAELVMAAWPPDQQRPTMIDTRRAPAIEWVAHLGAAAIETAAPKPLYLRAPDAKPQDAARLARQ